MSMIRERDHREIVPTPLDDWELVLLDQWEYDHEWDYEIEDYEADPLDEGLEAWLLEDDYPEYGIDEYEEVD